MNNILHMQNQSSHIPTAAPEILTAGEGAPVEIVNGTAQGPAVLVCEHASNRIPTRLGDLGLSSHERESHIAWDPGARAVAVRLAKALDAPLVCSTVSRLVYDCNRPPSSPDAMRLRSETTDIPGNRNLPAQDAQARIDQIYLPFQQALDETIGERSGQIPSPALITIHSFTPVYFGKPRDVEIGILHASDAALADAMLEAAKEHGEFRFERNQPYGPQDGVTHTLEAHGISRGLPNVMIEIRNDLIKDDRGVERVAHTLEQIIGQALETRRQQSIREGK